LLPALAFSGASLAHTPGAPGDDRLSLWTLDLAGVALLLLLALVYALGQTRLRRRSHADRFAGATFFWAGWAALVLALTPPIDTLSGVSFAVHMTQHEIMMLVAAPLLVISRPLGTLLWGAPVVATIVSSRPLRQAGAWFTAPLVAWITHAIVLWGWHVPAAFEASLRSTPVHWLQHASFFAAAAIYWWSVFAGPRAERRGIALLSVFTTAVHTTVLGTLLTFSTTLWYPTYGRVERPWALTAIEDQQLGGLIMWVPGGMVFLVVGLALAALWLKESEVRAARG
jgi:cytochrome c oxidase assembly factor CtaG